MAKVTWTYIESEFYSRFTRLSRPEQRGVLAALRAIVLSGTCGKEPEGAEQVELFHEEPSDEAGS